MREASQPIYLEGYHRPNFRDPDDAVYDVISDLLSEGRTSRLYRSLVRDKKIAVQAAGFSGFPGVKYPHLFAFYAIPVRGHTPAELRDAVHIEIERLKNEEVTTEELKMVKTRIRADLIRSLANNSGMAQAFATVQARYGDWRELFRQVDRVDKVSKADIRRVAQKIFVANNRTVGMLENATPAAAPVQQGAKQ
jgi:predicted Zn-dependent peptidase